MNASGWIQLALFVGIIVLITKPLGIYLFQVLDGKNTFLEPVIGPLERLTYRLLRVDERREQNWKQYAAATLLFSLVTMVFTYVILRLQDHLPFHGIIDGLINQTGSAAKTPITPDLAFNTAASFTTNTNWQSYSGENTMSYFSQMVGLASHNFWSAALGIAVAAALVRGIARHESGTVGNFWVDLVRLHYYLLLPLSIIYAVFLLSQGIPQNFNQYDTAQLTEAQTIQVPKTDAANAPVKDAAGNVVLVDQAVTTQSIVEGPIASQMAIKMLGTNGGGFVNANAAHPFENPTPLSNFIQILSIFAIPTGLTYYLGRMVKNQKHGWAVWGAMAAIFLVGVVTCWKAEADGNPNLYHNGVVADGRQHGGQGNALRHLQLRPVRHRHDGCVLRRRQRDARQLYAHRRVGAPVQHPARRNRLRRRWCRPIRHVDLRVPGGLHRGLDGRAARPSTWARKSRRSRSR